MIFFQFIFLSQSIDFKSSLEKILTNTSTLQTIQVII